MPTAPLIFITGASSGIGQALARRYARAGWRLALVARRAAELQAWVEAQGWSTEQVQIYAADVARTGLEPGGVRAAAAACLAAQGVPDVVVANAGISAGVDIGEAADLDVACEIFQTNVLGLLATLQPFIGPMRERGAGTLVGVASVAGVRGLPGHAAYSASKSAVIRICESLRVDLRPAGVRVVCILPGYIATPMTAGNPFPMPFLMPVERFADRAFQAIAQGARVRVIPWQMGLAAATLNLLPAWAYDGLMSRLGFRKPRRI